MLDAGPAHVTAARWPGTATREISFYVEALRTGNDAMRAAARQARARGEWLMADWAWQRTAVVEQVTSRKWFSVSRMFEADGALACWYVNFQRPPAWRADGWDTSDLALDLVADPDGAWHWKDEDEYAHDRRLGLITDTEHTAVQAARDEAVAMIQARNGMFAASPEERWLPDPAWAMPSLP